MFFLLSFIFISSTCFATYYSQCDQDRYVNERFFKDLQGGVFVDIGAHNGVTYSNTCFFEKERGWKGICIEPIPEKFAELKANRNCICIQGCISDEDGISQLLVVRGSRANIEMLSGLLHKYDIRHLQRIDGLIDAYGGSRAVIDVQCYQLNGILDENKITHIDFLSIDTEGGEFDIISSIDFSKFEIDVIAVEDNYGDSRFIPFLEKKGYKFVTRLSQDLLFVRRGLSSKF